MEVRVHFFYENEDIYRTKLSPTVSDGTISTEIDSLL